jgi:hypothetical protein
LPCLTPQTGAFYSQFNLLTWSDPSSKMHKVHCMA